MFGLVSSKVELCPQIITLLSHTELAQIIQVALHLPEKPFPPVGARANTGLQFEIAHRISIKHRQQSHLLSSILKLTGHLEGDSPAERAAAKKIRAVRLDRAHFTYVMSSHFPDVGQRLLAPVESARLERIEWSILTQMARQFVELNHVATRGVNTKEWPLRSVALNGYQRRPGRRPLLLAQEFCQLRYGRSLKQGRQGQSLSKRVGDLCKQPYRQ